MAFSLAPLALLLALLASPTQAMRKQIPSGIVNDIVNAEPSKSLVANPAKEKGSALIYIHQNESEPETPAQSEPETPAQPAQEPFIPPESGRCCTKATRDGGEMTRWFYYMKHFEDGTKGAAERVWLCPSSWSKTDDYDCNGKEAHNKFNYKENTDWVMCCKKGESTKYKYFSGNRCAEKGFAYSSCTNYECLPDVLNTDASEVTCEKGYKKIVNEDTTYGCGVVKPPGFTNQDCSGYSKKCDHKYCVFNSISGKGGSSDCSDKCSAMYGSTEKNAAHSMVHYSCTLLFSILAASVFA